MLFIYFTVLSPRENLNSNSVVVSVKPRLHHHGGAVAPHPPRYNSQNLVEEWLQKMPTTLPAEKLGGGGESTSALNLSVKPPTASTVRPAASTLTGRMNRSHGRSVSLRYTVSSPAGLIYHSWRLSISVIIQAAEVILINVIAMIS